MRIRKHNRAYFYILLTVLVFLIMIRYAFRVEIPRIVITSVIIAIALLGEQNEILAIMMSCIPMHNAIDLYTSLVVCAVIYVLKNIRQFKIDPAVILVLIIAAYELLHCFSEDFSLRIFLVNLTPLIVLIAVFGVDQKKANYAFVIRTMAVCAACMSLIMLVNVFVRSNWNLSSVFVNLQRLGHLSEEETLYGGSINPNTLGIISVLATTGLLQLRAMSKQNKIDVYLIIFLLLLGTFTLSRTFLVCLLLMTFLWIIGQRGSFKDKLKAIVSIILIAGILLGVLAVVFPSVLANFTKRFQTDDITTGRDMLMVIYHEFIMDNPKVLLFGIGLNNFREKVVNVYHVSENVPHNSIQEIVVAWGIPGIIMVVLLFIMIIIESKRYGRRKALINYIPLLIIIAKSMAGQLLTSGYTMLALSFAYLSLCQDFRVPEKSPNQVNNSVSKTEIL